MTETSKTRILHFGAFELDLESEKLLKNGRTIRLQPQPFRLLRLLAGQPGTLVTRQDIQAALWPGETFVDFEQGVNFAIKQVREALGDRAESPIYIQTVPRRGYRFVAPVRSGDQYDVVSPLALDSELQRLLWENIVDLRLAEDKRRKQLAIITVALILMAAAVAVLFLR